MKKSLIIAAALTLGAVASQAQGLVSINLSGGSLVSTNGAGGIGKAYGATTSGYYFELLTSASTTLPSTDNQLASSGGTVNASALAAWSDTGVGAAGAQSALSAGKITAGTSVSANNWVAPSGAAYDDTQSYIIIGWSGSYGTTYSAFLTSLNAGLAAGGYFGSTAVALNYAGGGPNGLPAVNMWGNSTATTGYGLTSGLVLNQIVAATPEPTTMALAGLGGLALLGLRRKK